MTAWTLVPGQPVAAQLEGRGLKLEAPSPGLLVVSQTRG